MEFINKLINTPKPPSVTQSNVQYKEIKLDDVEIPTLPKKIRISLNGLNKMQQGKLINELLDKIAFRGTMKITQPKMDELLECYEDDALYEATKTCLNSPSNWWLAHRMVPKTIEGSKDLIFFFVKNKLCINMIEDASNQIDVNYVNNNGETCLWDVSDIGYLIDLLSSEKLNFDVNILNKNLQTFMWNFALSFDNRPRDKCLQLMKILKKKKYIVDTPLINAMMVYCNECNHMIYNMLKNSGYDITSSTLWLNILINKYDIKWILAIVKGIILTHVDHKMIFNRIMVKYSSCYATADADMLTIMNSIKIYNMAKLLSMITYTNEKGNNLLHVAASYHLEKCMRFIIEFANENNIDLLSIKNNDGKLPYNLYTENSIQHLLFKEIKIF